MAHEPDFYFADWAAQISIQGQLLGGISSLLICGMLVHLASQTKRALAERIRIGDGKDLMQIVQKNKVEFVHMFYRTDLVRRLVQVAVPINTIIWVIAMCCRLNSDPYTQYQNATTSHYAFYILASAFLIFAFWYMFSSDTLHNLRDGPISIVGRGVPSASTPGLSSFL